MTKLPLKALIAALVLAFAGYTVAQPQETNGAGEAEAAEQADGASNSEMDRDKASGQGDESECQAYPLELPDAQLADAMRAIFEDIYDGIKVVVELQKLARKQNDVIKLNCINDKLREIKQLTNVAEKAKTDFVAAESQESDGDGTGAKAERAHQHERVATSGEEVCRLVEEAKLCLGEELIYLGPLNVDVDEPGLDEPESAFPSDDVDLEPPAYASPFA